MLGAAKPHKRTHNMEMGPWTGHIIELHPGRWHFQEDVQHQGMRLRFR